MSASTGTSDTDANDPPLPKEYPGQLLLGTKSRNCMACLVEESNPIPAAPAEGGGSSGSGNNGDGGKTTGMSGAMDNDAGGAGAGAFVKVWVMQVTAKSR